MQQQKKYSKTSSKLKLLIEHLDIQCIPLIYNTWLGKDKFKVLHRKNWHNLIDRYSLIWKEYEKELLIENEKVMLVNTFTIQQFCLIHYLTQNTKISFEDIDMLVHQLSIISQSENWDNIDLLYSEKEMLFFLLGETYVLYNTKMPKFRRFRGIKIIEVIRNLIEEKRLILYEGSVMFWELEPELDCKCNTVKLMREFIMEIS